ncbi:MAG TPA: signal peptidase I [Actinomycetota bacterium]
MSAKRKRPFWREVPVLVVVALVLALLIKTFLVQAFSIPSQSMENTLQPGDRVLVNRISARLHPPHRGDVIVFEDHFVTDSIHRSAPSAFLHWLIQGLGGGGPEGEFKIKRVIGLPGDTVQIDRCVVYVDGKPLGEPYVSASNDRLECRYGPVHVPPRSLFVLGDNRDHSADSRFGLGFIPFDKVVGRAFVVIWPPSRVGWIRSS